MVNFSDIITAPYKIAGAAPKLALNLCTGKTHMSDLNPCSRNDTSTTSSDHSGGGLMSNPLGGVFGGNGGKKTKYLDYSFNKLPGKAQNAAKTLGYNESNWTGWAPAEDKWWEDLNSSEREAAETLGWDQSAWDGKYEDKDWNDLPKDVQDAAETLGFTSQAWNNDEWPYSTDKYWNEFSDDEKKALNTLGYSNYDWE